MHLTQGQLELIAQLGPVFLLVLVVERQGLLRLQEIVNEARISRGDKPEDLRVARFSIMFYTLLLAVMTLVALFASGRSDGVDGVAGVAIAVLFVFGVMTVVILAMSLILGGPPRRD